MERIDLETALELILSRTIPIDEVLKLPLLKARGLVAGSTIHAPMDNPPFDRAPLDGFAFRSADTANASEANPVRLRVVGVVCAGSVYEAALLPGEALRIMTGAPMPGGSDAMLPKEDVREEAQEVLIFRPVKTHENYIFQGEDIQKGQPLISPGERLDFVRLGILAGMGLAEVPVFRPPEIGILCTGDELIPPGDPLPPGKIYNNNGILLSTRLRELGFHPHLLPIMEDESEAAVSKIRTYMEGTSIFPGLDLLITTGAVSVGDKDIMRDVLTLLGAERLFWRMNFKPGSAILCGMYREKLLICLSGNPFAAVANLELLVRPVLAKLARRPDLETRRRQARLENSFPKPSGARRFIRARLLAEKESGLPLVSLPEGHASGNMRSLLGCNCFVDIPALSGSLSAGSIVEVVQYNV